MLLETKLLAAVCLIAAAWLYAPKPRVTTVGASFRIAPDSSVVLDATVSLTGSLRPGDMIRFNPWKDGTLINAASRDVAGTSALGISLPAPDHGATSQYWVCARLVVGGSPTGASVCSSKWSYTRPQLPAPTIDSVRITPASATLTPGQSLQFQVAIFSR